MEVYLIEQENMTRIDEVDVDLEKDLEDRLVRTESAEIGGVEILYIGQQGTTEGGKIYDLVGFDEDGNLVVVELKQGKAPRRVIAQALDYVSRLKYQDYEDLEEDYEDFRREHDYDQSKSLREHHREHFELDEPLSSDEFNTQQRMIIIGTSFDDATTNMADYLRDEGELDVMLVQYERYKDSEEDVELLTTNPVRRPLSEEPAAQSDKSLTDKQKRRKEFWKDFQSEHQEHGLSGSGVRKSASYSIYVFTSGRRNRPAYIRPKVSYDTAYNEIRFYEGARSVVTDSGLRDEFERAVSKAVSNLDLDLPSDIGEANTLKWDHDETRENFDLLTIRMEDSNHNQFQDDQKVKEIKEWLMSTSLALEEALNEFEEEGYITT